MIPCRLMALQSVSIAPGTSMPVKVYVSARALGALSVRKTKTVKLMRSNKLVLYLRMWPPEVWAHHAMQAVFPCQHGDFRLGSRFSRRPGAAFGRTQAYSPLNSDFHHPVREQYSPQMIWRHRRASKFDPSNRADYR